MSKATDDLTKAINLGQQAADILQKSHVKAYTRTTASGASVQVKEHDDKRQTGRKDYVASASAKMQDAHDAAEKASNAADKHQAGMDWNKPDTKTLHELHHIAAVKHIDAMESAHKAGDSESMKQHYYKASMHLGASHSAGTFNKKDAEQNAKNQTKMADHLSDIANQHKTEHNAHSLDHGSSIHLLAMEQHARAKEAHIHAANQVDRGTEEDDAHMDAIDHHQAKRELHGKQVSEISKIAISASDKAYAAGDKAEKSGKAEDHQAAAAAHAEAAKLDFDSEGQAEHKKKAIEHDNKANAKPAEKDATKKMTDSEAIAHLQHVADHKAVKARKAEDWKDTEGGALSTSGGKKAHVNAKEIEGTDVRHFDHKEVYGHNKATSPGADDFDPKFHEKNKGEPFVLDHPNGSKYLVDPQGYNYSRYVSKIVKDK